MRLESYLERIGHEGRVRPDLDCLKELNGLLQWALEEIGFEVSRCVAGSKSQDTLKWQQVKVLCAFRP